MANTNQAVNLLSSLESLLLQEKRKTFSCEKKVSSIKIKSEKGKKGQKFYLVQDDTSIEVEDIELHCPSGSKLKFFIDQEGDCNFWHRSKDGVYIPGAENYICAVPKQYKGDIPLPLFNKFLEIGLIIEKNNEFSLRKRIHKTWDELTQETEAQLKVGDFVKTSYGMEGKVCSIFGDSIAILVGNQPKILLAKDVIKDVTKSPDPVLEKPKTLQSGKPMPKKRS